MKILITGGAGFLGSELVNYFSKNKKLKLTIIDDLSKGYYQRIKNIKNIKFIKKDVCNLKQINLPKFNWIIHCSAIAPLPDNQSSHFDSLKSNVAQCGSVIDFCIKSGTKNIIFLSTSAVYEKEKTIPYNEKSSTPPVLMYPTSKYLAEKYFDSVVKSYDLKIISLRLANIFGKRQDYFRKQMPFLGYLIKNSLLNKELKLFAKGNYKRDYLHVNDLVSLINKILNFKNFNYQHYIFNVGSSKNYSVLDFIKKIQKITKKKLKITWGNKNQYWNKYKNIYLSKIKLDKKLIKKEVEKKVFLDNSKVMSFFNWKPKVTIEQGLKECVNYAKKEIIK